MAEKQLQKAGKAKSKATPQRQGLTWQPHAHLRTPQLVPDRFSSPRPNEAREACYRDAAWKPAGAPRTSTLHPGGRLVVSIAMDQAAKCVHV
ncbi:uncharacterized protein PG986_014737 [Apiospora aurea]|uniref:Uncharacterized protein n=1 Tax=Apiospora aurea TaxID=335848 RepID=A0ABR1PUS8_9PEZI